MKWSNKESERAWAAVRMSAIRNEQARRMINKIAKALGETT